MQLKEWGKGNWGRAESAGGESGMFWQAALKERWGALQMLACNNGSRSHFHRFLEPGTLPLGNHFHASPPSMSWSSEGGRQIAQCPRSLPGEHVWKARAKFSKGNSQVAFRGLATNCFIIYAALLKGAAKEKLASSQSSLNDWALKWIGVPRAVRAAGPRQKGAELRR